MLHGYCSKSWGDEGRLLEVKGVGYTGCTSTTVPIAVVREHGLKIEKVDPDEPGMEAFGGTKVNILGQVKFWYKPRRFKRKKFVRGLVSDTPGKEILFSWQVLFEWGVIGKNFPYPPDSDDDDSTLKPDSVNKLIEENPLSEETEEETPPTELDEDTTTPFPQTATPTHGGAVNHTGDSLGGSSSEEVLELGTSTSPNFEKLRKDLLKEFEDVFKEELSPSDRINGVQRIEID